MNKIPVLLVLVLFILPSHALAIYPYDCYGLNVASAPTCGDVPLPGCCDAAGRTVWCQDGELFCINCAAQGNTCGWDSTNEFYDCAQVGEDPSMLYPYECFDSCTPSCIGRVCGSDGCAGSCGTCGGGQVCIDGLCYDTPPACQGTSAPVGSECGDVNYIGCCDSTGKVLWCEGAALYCIDCVGVGYPSCGWNADMSGYDCDTDGSADPSGLYPQECGPAACVPNCASKSCGEDGCGGSCGTCLATQVCNASFQCETPACVPACSGKYCGPDGCGGLCGQCAATEECTAEGMCQLIPCDPTCAGKQCGGDGCGGTCGECSVGFHCLAGLCQCDLPCAGDCCTVGAVCFESSCCMPKCSDRECGSDGCGGTCGTCSGEDTCDEFGQCQAPPCEPSCDGKACGDDGCGGSCGSCGLYSACVSGTCLCEFNCAGNCCAPSDKCVSGACCSPDCTNRECGDDGCGSSCGSCGLQQVCVEGSCTTQTSPDADNDLVTADSNGEVSFPDVVVPDRTESDQSVPDQASVDQSGKDASHEVAPGVDTEADQGNTIVVPTEDLGTETTTITTSCAASSQQPGPYTVLLLLALTIGLTVASRRRSQSN